MSTDHNNGNVKRQEQTVAFVYMLKCLYKESKYIDCSVGIYTDVQDWRNTALHPTEFLCLSLSVR